MSEKKMNYREAYSWLNQSGIKATLFNRDWHTNEALRKAIEALKKQVPMSYKMMHCPERTFKNGENGEIVNVFAYHCPYCNQVLGYSDWDGKPNKEWLEYCDKCGQRIDWIHDVEVPKFENIIESIKFIEGRYKVIELLKTIVYDLTQFANERNHIQKIIEQHFWLFGEQYNLASADQRMKKALEKYINILYGENDINTTLKEDAEQERRMDIFMCNSREVETSFETVLEENIIVELKAPKVPLSKKVLRQVEDYMDFIRKQPDFNSEYRKWKFIAVCKQVDEDIKSRYETFKDKGKIGLVVQVENYEVYAYTWDDVFKSFELRHAPILKRLKYDREQLAKELLDEVASDEGRGKVDALTDIAVSAISNVQ